jgi:hypothetical protein
VENTPLLGSSKQAVRQMATAQTSEKPLPCTPDIFHCNLAGKYSAVLPGI